MSLSQHLRDQAEYFYSKGCTNQKNEIVASPSYIPMYKGKTEEQILYEYLKEKRGSSQQNADRILAQSSILERERPSKGPSDRSVSNLEEPKEPVSEQKGLQSRNLAQSTKIESKRSDVFDDDFTDKKESVGRASMINHRDSPLERKAEVEVSSKIKKEDEKPKENEDSKPKKTSNLQQRLIDRRKGLADSTAQKRNTEVNAESVPRDDPQPSRLGESIKVNVEEDSKGPEEIPKKAVKEDQFDMLTASFSSTAFEGNNYGNENYLEEPRSLMSQVTGPSKHYAPEKKVVEEQREVKANKVPELEGPHGVNVGRRHYERESIQNNKKTLENFQERDRDLDSSRSQPGSGHEKLNMTAQDEDTLSQKSSNLRESETLVQEERRKKFLNENEAQERREESEYMAMSRVNETKDGNEVPSMKQSQVNRSSRQREVEELDFDEAEREPLVRHHDEQMRESRSSMKQPKEEELRRSEYMNEERNKKTKQDFMGPKEPQEYVEKRVSEQEPESAKFLKSVTSLAESKVQKSEKGEARSVLSYAKNTEQLVKLLLAKMEKMEEDQMQMMQIMKRQEQKIKKLQSSLGMGDDEDF